MIHLQFFAPKVEGSNWVTGIGEQIINEYHDYNPAAEVAVRPIDLGDILDELLAAVAAGQPPDISYVDAHLPKELGLLGIALAITPWLKVTGLDIEDYWYGVAFDSVYPGNGSVFDIGYQRHWFGLPWAPTVTTFFYNQDVFAEASYGPVFVEPNLYPHRAPANWDELLDATTLTRKKRGAVMERLGFWHGSSSLAWWLVPYWQQGGQLLSEDGLTSTIDNEEMARAFAFTLSLLDRQGGLNAINTLRGDEPQQALFATGGCAMWTDAIDVMRSDEWAEKFAQVNIGTDTYPVVAGGSPTAFRGGGAHIIPFLSEYRDNAFLFLEWLFKESNDLRFNDARGSLPARRSVAYSPEFTRGDPLRLHAVREMERAHGLVSGPGARVIAGIHEKVARSIWNREKTIQEALREGNEQAQQALERALRESEFDY